MSLTEKVSQYASKYGMFENCDAILCGVSGGCDSVCLLNILKTLSQDIKIFAAHFNHNLRGDESDRDEKFVKALCEKMGVELFIGGGDVKAYAALTKMGIEEAARTLRYDFFEETAGKIKNCKVATAHNADDNAETVILNLTRGSGLTGLAGIPPVRGIYVRPLLSVPRAEIEAYMSENRLEHIEDSTNRDTAYSRNRIRHDVIPVLKSINPAFSETVFRATELVREDGEYLLAEAEKLLVIENDAYCLDIDVLRKNAKPLVSRAVRNAAEKFGVSLSAANVDDVITMILSGNTSAEIDLPSGLAAIRSYNRLTIRKKPQEVPTFKEKELKYNGWTVLESPPVNIYYGKIGSAYKKGIIYGSLNTFFFEKNKICGNIIVRPRKTGDCIKLQLNNGHKSLKKLFIDMKIPRNMREMIPVFSDSAGVVAVAGIGQDIRAAANEYIEENTLMLKIEERKSDA